MACVIFRIGYLGTSILRTHGCVHGSYFCVYVYPFEMDVGMDLVMAGVIVFGFLFIFMEMIVMMMDLVVGFGIMDEILVS